MTQFAVDYVVGDDSEILEKFDHKEAAMQAAKEYRKQYNDGVISVISADFDSVAWKERRAMRIYKVYW